MTSNLNAYFATVEANRANVARETETNRHNLAIEQEEKRANFAREVQNYLNYREQQRHNRDTIAEQRAATNERRRAAIAQEGLQATQNRNTFLYQQGQLSADTLKRHEAHRSNLAGERLQDRSITNTYVLGQRNAATQERNVENQFQIGMLNYELGKQSNLLTSQRDAANIAARARELDVSQYRAETERSNLHRQWFDSVVNLGKAFVPFSFLTGGK